MSEGMRESGWMLLLVLIHLNPVLHHCVYAGAYHEWAYNSLDRVKRHGHGTQFLTNTSHPHGHLYVKRISDARATKISGLEQELHSRSRVSSRAPFLNINK